MTDRINSLTVALKEDIRIDDAEQLIIAIRMLTGVLAVEPNVTTPELWVAHQRVRSDLGQKLWEIIYPKM
jgi:hypothetical protein